MAKSKTTRVKRTQRDYTLGFKLAVVDQVEKGELTYKQAQQHYGIQGRSTVLVWLRKHGKLDWQPTPVNATMTKNKETPAQKIKRLERELADEQARNHVLKGMITIYEKDYGLTLGKKSFAKVSGSVSKKKPSA